MRHVRYAITCLVVFAVLAAPTACVDGVRPTEPEVPKIQPALRDLVTSSPAPSGEIILPSFPNGVPRLLPLASYSDDYGFTFSGVGHFEGGPGSFLNAGVTNFSDQATAGTLVSNSRPFTLVSISVYDAVYQMFVDAAGHHEVFSTFAKPAILNWPGLTSVRVYGAPDFLQIHSIVVKFDDDTPPVITRNVTGTLGANGWYTSNVAVSWDVADPQTTFTATGCEAKSLTADGPAATLSCSATSNGGTSEDHVDIKIDQTAPTVAFAGLSTYTPDQTVSITCTASDATSGIDELKLSCPGARGLASSFGIGTHTLTASATDNAGLSTTKTFTFYVKDNTPPVITPSVTGTLGSSGWYTSKVTVKWQATDQESAITSPACPDAVIDVDTQSQPVTCSATSDGGTATKSVTIKRDASPPVITFAGAASYTVDQDVAISCAVSDPTSGVVKSDCPMASGAGYAVGVGPHTLAASATNGAGFTSSVAQVYTVTATTGGVSSLVTRWVSNAGVANSLTTKLLNGDIGAFVNEVNAQSGKKIPADKAAILIQLAGKL